MLEIKVQCDCGQRFKFDVEPVNGRMPFTVNCPICGADGTAKANEILGELAPPPTASPVPAAKPALKIHSAAPAMAVAMDQPLAAPGLAQTAAAIPQPPAQPAAKPSFALGLLGALVGSLVGGLLYYLLFNYTGLRFKIIAIVVGYLSGLGADLLGRKEGSKELGMIAATLAIAGILGAQYLVARSWWNQALEAMPVTQHATSTYESRVAEAKAVVAVVPTGSDNEIRAYLAKSESTNDAKVDPATFTQDDIVIFRETTLKEHQDYASGKITTQEHEQKVAKEKAAEKKEKDESEGTFQTVFMVLVLSRVNIFACIGAAILAYKVCANA